MGKFISSLSGPGAVLFGGLITLAAGAIGVLVGVLTH